MPGKLLLFQWETASAEKRAEEIRRTGWAVAVESEDGARGIRHMLNDPPQLAIFDLARRPSHSRETASAIRKYKTIRRTPILFVDGKAEDIEKIQVKIAGALFVSSEFLLERLAHLDL